MRRNIFNLLSITFLLLTSFTNAQGVGTPVIQFDGVDDYVNLGGAGDNLRTIELWFAPGNMIDNTSTLRQTLVGRETSLANNTPEFQLYFWNGDGRLRFTIDQGPGASSTVFSTTNVWNAGEWYHVAVVINSDPLIGTKMFINGMEESFDLSLTAATAPFPGTYAADYTALGCWGDFQQRFFRGKMEDVRFSTEALYTDDFEPPCPAIGLHGSTVGLWNFDDGPTFTTEDSSPSGFDGQVNGALWATSFICENPCNCSANVSIDGSSPLTAAGTQSVNLNIDTGGEPVVSVCIELPYFISLVDPDCFLCDSLSVTGNGTITAGTNLAGVVGVLDDPYSLGHSRKICYEFDVPTVINETIQLDLQFPAVFDSPNCPNEVKYCLDVEIKDEDCRMCEYEVCPPVETTVKSKVDTGDVGNTPMNMNESLEVSVYPVPASKEITVEINDADLVEAVIALISLDGTLVKEEKVNANRAVLDLEGIAVGTYILKVQSGGKETSEKVIVNQ